MVGRFAIFAFCSFYFCIANASEDKSNLQTCIKAEKDAVKKRAECYDLLVQELKVRDPLLQSGTQTVGHSSLTPPPLNELSQSENASNKLGNSISTDDQEKQKRKEDDHPYLESRLPNSVGYTGEKGDRPFLDANLSFQYPILYNYLGGGCNKLRALLYFSYTGRFGQYIAHTDSSPVITKTFNPEIFLRIFSPLGLDQSQEMVISNNCDKDEYGNLTYKNGDGNLAYYNQKHHATPSQSNQFVRTHQNNRYAPLYYIDLQYGHLSNGQGIDNQASLDAIANTTSVNGDKEFAKKYISRGWDYYGLEANISNVLTGNDTARSDSLDIQWHHYIGGLLQTTIEENPWEYPSSNIRRLKQVSGLRAKYDIQTGWPIFNSAALTIETGTESPFRYTTSRFEFGVFKEALCVPFIVWLQSGYNNDLAQYYKSVKSGGIAFQFTTFGDNGCRWGISR